MGLASQMMGRDYWVAKFRWLAACDEAGCKVPFTGEIAGTPATNEAQVQRRADEAMADD